MDLLYTSTIGCFKTLSSTIVLLLNGGSINYPVTILENTYHIKSINTFWIDLILSQIYLNTYK